MSYSAIVLIPNSMNLDLTKPIRRLQRPECGLQVEWLGPDTLRIADGEWTISLSLEQELHVAEESCELIAQYGAGRADSATLASAKRRISIYSEEDPNMEHFNAFALVLEAFQEIPGLGVFDAASEEFL
ncbi:MAG: hypothetical protein ACREJ2_15550 [Planctomycetota bacterium]